MAVYRDLPWGVRDVDVYAGRAYRHEVEWEEGTDKSGSTFTAEVRDVRGGTLLASFTVDDTDAATGVIVLGLTEDDTVDLPARCVWDLVETDAGGDRSTLLTGAVVVTGWVTE